MVVFSSDQLRREEKSVGRRSMSDTHSLWNSFHLASWKYSATNSSFIDPFIFSFWQPPTKRWENVSAGVLLPKKVCSSTSAPEWSHRFICDESLQCNDHTCVCFYSYVHYRRRRNETTRDGEKEKQKRSHQARTMQVKTNSTQYQWINLLDCVVMRKALVLFHSRFEIWDAKNERKSG